MGLIKELTRIIEENLKQEAEETPKEEDKLVLKEKIGSEENENALYLGDNLKVMRALLKDENVAGKLKLIYIDPPFYSKASYDAVIRIGNENVRHRAYEDKWEDGLSSYLDMLTKRLILMKRLLSSDGLIWLHLDWHVVHYAKIIMDEIFGADNFVNEIIWTYKSGGSTKKHFARKHDNILVYSKNKKFNFYPLKEKSYNRQFKPYNFKGVKEYQDEIGWYTMVNMKDVWSIDMVGRTSGERTGYATQKPEQLLRRIVESCSKEGDLCADFFCGSGTLPAVCQKMGRRFIGCDGGRLAIESTATRLYKENASFQVYETLEEASKNIKTENGFPKIKVYKENLNDSKEMVTLELQPKDQDEYEKISYWSIDYENSTQVFHPKQINIKIKGKIELTFQKELFKNDILNVKIVDVFGNSRFERIGNERKN